MTVRPSDICDCRMPNSAILRCDFLVRHDLIIDFEKSIYRSREFLTKEGKLSLRMTNSLHAMMIAPSNTINHCRDFMHEQLQRVMNRRII